MSTRRTAAFLLALFLAACGSPQGAARDEQATVDPPPLPEDSETVAFERAPAENAPELSTENQAAAASGEDRPQYWGVAPGEPLPLLWDDLMPEGSFEDLARQQEEYLAALTQRYQANASTLADAEPFAEIEEGSALDFMPQLGSFDVVEDLDGELIRIPGYVVPFDFDPAQRHTEFLFVPYMGACIHTPPPPPNQIIFVRADPAMPVKDIWAPYWLEGELSAEKNVNELGDAAYSLTLEKLEPYPLLGAGP